MVMPHGEILIHQDALDLGRLDNIFFFKDVSNRKTGEFAHEPKLAPRVFHLHIRSCSKWERH